MNTIMKHYVVYREIGESHGKPICAMVEMYEAASADDAVNQAFQEYMFLDPEIDTIRAELAEETECRKCGKSFYHWFSAEFGQHVDCNDLSKGTEVWSTPSHEVNLAEAGAL